MPSKPSASKNKTPKDPNANQLRWTRIVVGIFAVLIILSMVLSSISLGN